MRRFFPLLLATASPAFADPLSLDLAAAAVEPPPGAAQAADHEARLQFGREGHWSWSVGAGAAFGSRDSDGYYQGFVSFDGFLVDDFQIGVELGGWFFDQEVDDALGGSAIVNFRWHFLPWEESKDDWSLFAELGIGVAGMSEDVPPGTDTFNFTPRAGVGATFRLGEGAERLLVGARWQHFSNARVFGGDDNDASDSVMFYAGVVFPF